MDFSKEPPNGQGSSDKIVASNTEAVAQEKLSDNVSNMNNESKPSGSNTKPSGIVAPPKDEIRKRSKSFKRKRNYRQSSAGMDNTSSDEEHVHCSSKLKNCEENPPCVKEVPGKLEQPAVETLDRDTVEHEIESNPPEPEPNSDSTDNMDIPEIETDPITPPESQHDDLEDIDDDDDDDSSPSDDDDLEFFEDDEDLEDSSSDSSDSLLDLEDRPIGACGQTKTDTNSKNNIETASKKVADDLKKKRPQVLLKPKPKSTWNAPLEIFRRELGYRGKSQPQCAQVFRSKFYGSLFSAERLELMHKLDGHEGCVNCLHFNFSGTKLVSGSDDLHIKIWNYNLGKLLTSIHSGHRANVFQAKFLPLVGIDNILISCARDNQVRLTTLDTSGAVSTSRKVAQHRGAAHKLTVSPETPHVALTCGEDGVVFSVDIREEKPQKILTLRSNGKKVALYSIHNNPSNSHEFCVTGRDEYIRIYDTRALSRARERVNGEHESSNGTENETQVLKRFCPHHLQGNSTRVHVTAAVYNYNGKEIVGSYNDENVYLFDTNHSDMADCVKVYEGHRNNSTVKGVNFYGDKSQYIVSGSDCGHIFIWDKETECIVNFLRGDENGVVNCLETHPTAPILATSGLDDDVKIWIPSAEAPPKMGDLGPTVKKNIRRRQEELERQPDTLDGHLMWQLIHHMNRRDRNRRREEGLATDSDSAEDSDAEEEGGERQMECRIS